MAKKSISQVLTSWERILAAAEFNRKDLASLETQRRELHGALSDVKALYNRRAMLKAEVQHLTRELHRHLATGRDMASRIQSGARGCYGIHSEKLSEFGVKPIHRRKPPAEKAGPAEAPRIPTCCKQ